jgi:hypothetical protein
MLRTVVAADALRDAACFEQVDQRVDYVLTRKAAINPQGMHSRVSLSIRLSHFTLVPFVG